MAIPEYDVFVGDELTVGPSRPSLDDLGGAAKENDPTNVPDPVRMPCAEDYNQKTWALAALCRVIPSAIVSIEYDGSNVPFVSAVWSLRSDVTPATFTVVEVSTGELFFNWPAGTFPTGPQPCGIVNNDYTIALDEMRAGRSDVSEVYVVTRWGSNGVRTPFTVMVGGEGTS